MILEEQRQKKVYSDGQETERRMLEIARNYPEEASEAAISGSYDYTTNNTFSSVRRNLLNWYSFSKNATVLEIGAGMGSLTGLLCDSCTQVIALEMNENRAAVIRARYPKRKNLQVVVGDVNHVKLPEKFDYVVFVGVLEYAALFSDAADPFTEFLRTAAGFLKPDGRLLFAIENQYGLKYWCGAAEDHVQQPFAGIAGYEKPRTARTFSRAALERLLRNVGLDHQRFYAALPDYKFPTLLFTDEWKPSGSDLTNIAYTYGRNSLLVADERKLYADLAENGVVSFFANSFFVEASAASLEGIHPILVTARGENLPEYRVMTTVTSDQTIHKLAACTQAQTHLQRIAENEQTLDSRGISVLKMQMENERLVRKFSDLPRADSAFRDFLRRGDLNGILSLTDALQTALLKSSELTDNTENVLLREGLASSKDDFGPILKNGYIDMTFYNSFLDGADLVFFDQEWCVPGLPAEFILYYAVKSIYARGAEDALLPQGAILAQLGISSAHQPLYDQLESCIWSKLFTRQGDFYGAGGYCTQYGSTNKFASVTDRLTALAQEKERLECDLQCKNGHIDQLLQSERDLTDEVRRKEETIAQQGTKLARKEQTIAQQGTKLAEKEQTIAQQGTKLAEKEHTIAQQGIVLAEKEQTIRNKEGHIELLLGSDRELERIKASRSWRFMGYVWKLRDGLIPKGSKRRLLGKMAVKFAKHPLHFLSKCTPHKVSKFFRTLRREGVEGTSRRLDDCLIGSAIPPQELMIENVPETTPEAPVKTVSDYTPLHVPQWDKPTVSIVIPVYNQFDYTYACVKSILQNSGDMTYEILIADDCSTDVTRDIDAVISGLHTIRNAENLRFLRNCNYAAKEAHGTYILFLNNDTQVQENWLAPLVELLEKDKTIGMTGSKLVYPNGRLQEAGGIFWNDASAWNYGNRADPADPEYNYVKDVDYISGASICIRKALWEEIGGFDERFAPAYYEDSDLAFEVRAHGYRVVYQPLSVVVHFEGVSNGTDTFSGQKAYQVANQKKFHEKWKDVLEREHFPNGENIFVARDRSQNKKILLMVDHYVPMYDKDAGSRAVFSYLKLFVSRGLQVKFIGDNFYPHQPYTQTLQQMGIEVLNGNWYANHWKEWLKENGDYIRYAFLNRPHITVKYIDEVRKLTPARIIYFGHDLHFLREQREAEITGDLSLLKESEDWKKKELMLMRKADVSYYPSCVEEEIVHGIDPSISVKAVPLYQYPHIVDKPYGFDGRKDLMFIGGYNHHPNVDAAKWLADEIMPELVDLIPDIKIHMMGSNAPDEIKALADEHILFEGGVSDEQLADFYAHCRISVVPLRYGAGIKGKVLEAMSLGVPVMTTPIGAEGIAGAENILYIEEDAKAFAEKLAALYQNRQELERRSRESYQYIRENFSPEHVIRVIGPDFDMESTAGEIPAAKGR